MLNNQRVSGPILRPTDFQCIQAEPSTSVAFIGVVRNCAYFIICHIYMYIIIVCFFCKQTNMAIYNCSLNDLDSCHPISRIISCRWFPNSQLPTNTDPPQNGGWKTFGSPQGQTGRGMLRWHKKKLKWGFILTSHTRKITSDEHRNSAQSVTNPRGFAGDLPITALSIRRGQHAWG